MQEFFTINQIANILSVSPKTLYSWAKAGRISHIKIGGCIRIPGAELNRMRRGLMNNHKYINR